VDSILLEAFLVILIRDDDHNVHIGCRCFESVCDGATQQKGKYFGVALKIVSDVLYGLSVM
jgi:hypothetical protein